MDGFTLLGVALLLIAGFVGSIVLATLVHEVTK